LLIRFNDDSREWLTFFGHPVVLDRHAATAAVISTLYTASKNHLS